MSAGFNLAEKEPFPEVFDTVWTDSKRVVCESGKPNAFSRPVAPTQLHFLSFAVASLREDFHFQ
ncbi:hypothetical protein D5O62_05765 [Salmonella enterica subsp. enterica serovar Warnow]|nr:hypothetical protein [Salmonella enterica subsp. enterica serovar Abaetetuba]EAQ6134066.1 hypothetical protein [Salmonella enterica]EBY6258299.1 hypothetical protein [Salmonella enterica subsp. enterica serovar Warnow]